MYCRLQANIPFAVVGSNTLIEVGGKKVRGRLYPWGVVQSKCLLLSLIDYFAALDVHKSWLTKK